MQNRKPHAILAAAAATGLILSACAPQGAAPVVQTLIA